MNITKLIDTLQSYKNKGCNRVLISNNNFSSNQYIKKIELDTNNSEQINLIIDDVYIRDAIKTAKLYKDNDEIIKI
ncbi:MULTISPECIES: hypothetical protein [Brachyspira]|uniref:Uncharacterized protein n=1 Tax=Brachyspira hampsonii TaxID=1287055 RepID=A0AAC9TTK0_9SPIR|nr:MULTISPECIES: hypothetical protein [Brachyspira]ASJ21556.1 hypothetical protein BHAMNSH16_07830 [Brachyspira hampsonii]ASJ22498.1 hypothetical protein BHAMNSH16_12945 [Brachyspira hampsonii]ELV05645.1 hypothetical protein H263_09024 [Brachyspira hampsonii 30599]MBW5380020.1 hypothetical protein [Brachyspira hampsonii]OEJ19836.1 hypothetical protein A9496_14040 [Brachyspira hampsonii]